MNPTESRHQMAPRGTEAGPTLKVSTSKKRRERAAAVRARAPSPWEKAEDAFATSQALKFTDFVRAGFLRSAIGVFADVVEQIPPIYSTYSKDMAPGQLVEFQSQIDRRYKAVRSIWKYAFASVNIAQNSVEEFNCLQGVQLVMCRVHKYCADGQPLDGEPNPEWATVYRRLFAEAYGAQTEGILRDCADAFARRHPKV